MSEVRALTVLDGRYKKVTKDLNDIFSEYGLIKYRTIVEIKWLVFIAKELKFAKISSEDIKKIESVLSDFNEQSALRVKEIESTTNHDVKAVEYYIKEELERKGLSDIKEWVHFACTSDDINNTAYALMLKEGKKYISENLDELLKRVEELALENKKIPMMSRTHGQPASPTTVGKEFINFAYRIRVENENLNDVAIEGKMNGATGNFNAHYFAFPEIDWIKASRNFIKNYLEIEPLTLTTQINPNNYISKLLHTLIRSASIMIDLDRDMWGYISHGYFKQKTKEGEVGSSTMPHKVNPIDFENSEGNLGIAISMMEHLSVKLLNSRFQRDLTDSTVLRNMGTLFGYFLIGIRSTLRGLGKIITNTDMLSEDLEKNPELLAEPIQTVMRVYEEENPYEKLKELTRGVKITQEVLDNFIDRLTKVPDEVKERMKKLTPESYVGLAEELVDEYFKEYNIDL
ncbi:MAG: adenylosuccinate lyase [Desulfobacterales bacterium]|nr:adenylosuccinate lyase [Desulfobacterales bacterium]MCP4159438.1 adenylosuccinate lyase [Deltaproteobacteria bacterium]